LGDIPSIDGGSVLVATGLSLEARIASGPGVVTVCSGGDPQRLRVLLSQANPRHLRAVISFGLAGGLNPALRAGDIVVASDVVSDGKSLAADPAILAAFATRLSRGRAAPEPSSIVGWDVVVSDPVEKAALHQAGAHAVDMESHVAAEFAAAHGLPFGVVRVICDPAERAVPPFAQRALGTSGGIRMPAIVGSLARNPSQVPALMGLGRDFAIALVALRRSRRLLGLHFGLVDAGDLVLDVT
jgi:adenosylhomocysteine nucleosidase